MRLQKERGSNFHLITKHRNWQQIYKILFGLRLVHTMINLPISLYSYDITSYPLIKFHTSPQVVLQPPAHSVRVDAQFFSDRCRLLSGQQNMENGQFSYLFCVFWIIVWHRRVFFHLYMVLHTLHWFSFQITIRKQSILSKCINDCQRNYKLIKFFWELYYWE